MQTCLWSFLPAAAGSSTGKRDDAKTQRAARQNKAVICPVHQFLGRYTLIFSDAQAGLYI